MLPQTWTGPNLSFVLWLQDDPAIEAHIGAVVPVQVGMPGAQALPVQEKTVSYVRKEFGATAEARKRPQNLAEAMVDADVEVAGIIEKGKLLTLTT